MGVRVLPGVLPKPLLRRGLLSSDAESVAAGEISGPRLGRSLRIRPDPSSPLQEPVRGTAGRIQCPIWVGDGERLAPESSSGGADLAGDISWVVSRAHVGAAGVPSVLAAGSLASTWSWSAIPFPVIVVPAAVSGSLRTESTSRRHAPTNIVDREEGKGIAVAVIEVEGLVKVYDGRNVVDGVTFNVEHGEIFGIVGPNGAGKTTIVESVEGLRRPDGGSIRVLGLDPIEDRFEVTERVGAQLQESRLQDKVKVREVLATYASFYRNPADWRGTDRGPGTRRQGGVAIRVIVRWTETAGLGRTRPCWQPRDRDTR